MGTYTKGGQSYSGYVVTLGSGSPGVVIGTTTTPPTTSASWFINGSGTAGLQQEIFRFATQVEQRNAFKVQDNPMGPFTYNINLVDNSGTPVLQTGMIQLQVWDSALQVNKKTLLSIDSSSASASGSATGSGGVIQNRLAFNFGDPGAMYITSPGDIIRLYFTPSASQNGVQASKSTIALYVDQLTQTG